MNERAWLLRSRETGEVLGRLSLTEQDMWNYACHFAAAPPFEAHKPYFEEISTLNEKTETGEISEAEHERLEQLYERLSTQFEIAYPDGEVASQEFLLSIHGSEASFRSMESI